MDKSNINLREMFCQIIALEDAEPADAAFRAGYGARSHPYKDSYHTTIGARLMADKDIQNRVHEIRVENADKDKDFQRSMIDDLKDMIHFDTAKNFKSSNCVLPNGRTVTDYYLATPVQNWDKKDRMLMCNGVDAQGRPKFIDKQWAWDKLLKIYNLDGKTNVDIEDIMSLFSNAGLSINKDNIPEVTSLQSLEDEDKG